MYKYILQVIKYKPCSFNQIRDLPKNDVLWKKYFFLCLLQNKSVLCYFLSEKR